MHRALQVDLGRPVALKVLLPTALEDHDALRRFDREARLTAALEHPAIVKLYDHGVENGIPWIAYEFIGGGSLRDLLDRGPVPIEQALEIGAQIAGALAAAHQAGVIHRDLKPENILITDGGRYKLADFGIARRQVDSSWQTSPGVILGTPYYMAPETLRDRPGASGDVYALGIVLYELIAGQLPCPHEEPSEILRWHLAPGRPELAAAAPHASAAVSALVGKAMEPRIEDRFKTARELELALVAAKGEQVVVEDRTARLPRGVANRLAATQTAAQHPPIPASQATRAVGHVQPPIQRAVGALTAVTAVLMAIALALHMRRVPPPPDPSATPSVAATASLNTPASASDRPWMHLPEERTHTGEYINKPLEEFRDAVGSEVLEESLHERARAQLQIMRELHDAQESKLRKGEVLRDRELMTLVRSRALAWNFTCQLGAIFRKLGASGVPLDQGLASEYLNAYQIALAQAIDRAVYGRAQFRMYVHDFLMSVLDVARADGHAPWPIGVVEEDLRFQRWLQGRLAEPAEPVRHLLDRIVLKLFRLGRGLAAPADRKLLDDQLAELETAWQIKIYRTWLEKSLPSLAPGGDDTEPEIEAIRGRWRKLHPKGCSSVFPALNASQQAGEESVFHELGRLSRPSVTRDPQATERHLMLRLRASALFWLWSEHILRHTHAEVPTPLPASLTRESAEVIAGRFLGALALVVPRLCLPDNYFLVHQAQVYRCVVEASIATRQTRLLAQHAKGITEIQDFRASLASLLDDLPCDDRIHQKAALLRAWDLNQIVPAEH